MPGVKRSAFMSVKNAEESRSAPDPQQELLQRIQGWYGKSKKDRERYEARWAKNTRLLKGVWEEGEKTKSAVRNRSKIFFRKIWATQTRLLASFYNAFFRDPETFKIEGRSKEDVQPAGVLQALVEYRRDLMMRRQYLFLKMIWSLLDILSFGICTGKLFWNFDGEKVDQPEYVAYPPEQVFFDMSADTPDKIRYVIFEDFMSKDEMEDMGYKNLDKASPESIPSSTVRSARFQQFGDPMSGMGENEYPKPGTVGSSEKESTGERYRVWECFYRKEGKWKFCVTNAANCVLKDEVDNPYGDFTPLVVGICLTEPHLLIGEGFPEVLEGPQESFNFNLNLRKDNVTLAMNKPTIASRYGGVDFEALVNRRPGGVILADDINAVKELEMRDVTQSSYTEAIIDDGMIQEMSGITPSKQGMGDENKATVAQINYSEGNAKIDLFIAMVSETFMKDFYYKLALLESKFETDERIIRVANANWREKIKTTELAGNVEEFDFDFDCIMNVGAGTVGRQFEINQNLLLMDRMIMANQASLGLMQLLQGTGSQNKIKFFDVSKMLAVTLPKLGHKNVDDFFVEITPPPMPAETGGPAGLAGSIQPQIGGGGEIPNEANNLQGGGLGGV